MTTRPDLYGANIGWDDLLDPGETILWQGRPEPGFALHPIRPMQMGMGVVFMLFSLFWIAMAEGITSGMRGAGDAVSWFPKFGWFFFAIGAWKAGLYLLWAHFVRQRTVYSLSDRRAFVATDLPVLGRRLTSHPLDNGSPVALDDGMPGSVWFATRRIQTKNGSTSRRIGFERIKDARKVYRLIRQSRREGI
mgnify:CR=1 FL=1